MKELLIVGVDPGSTVGYAVLDLEGKVIALGSEKSVSLSLVLKKIHGYGSILIIASDKKKTPFFAEKIKARTGARILPLVNDLSIIEKNELTSSYTVKNHHEADALAAALYSYKRISRVLEDLKKVSQAYHVDYHDLVGYAVRHPEKNMLNIVEHLSADQEALTHKKDLIPSQPTSNAALPSPARGESSMIRSLKRELYFLQMQRKDLLRKLEYVKKKCLFFSQKLDRLLHDPGQRKDALLAAKERQMLVLQQQLRKEQARAHAVFKDWAQVKSFMLSSEATLGVKKLPDLGRNQKHAISRIRETILFVEEPQRMSKEMVQLLVENHVNVMICKNMPNKPNHMHAQLPFLLIDAAQITYMAYQDIVLINKRSLEREIKAQWAKKDMVQQVLQEYQRERSFLMFS